VQLHILVQTRAAETEIVGVHDGRIKVRLTAPPVEGAANQALLKFLAKRLGLPQGAMVITAGASSRRKMVVAGGISLEHATERLLTERRSSQSR